MEVENMSRKTASTKEEEEDDVPLPGFRFHPTDEELVGFYLRRKVEKRPVTIELIKQADIYKYDPWDLPKSSSVEDQKEWYFFCKRGRKYKNSVRPNRVTGSGFWKATGIDRPIYKGRDCIGLKKSLVYYRGSAGKGTKTEWMMHEFRLPPLAPRTARTTHTQTDATTIAQEAEVWTLCRILKRNVSYRKSEPWRNNIQADAKKSTNTTCDQNNAQSRYISFQHREKKPFSTQEYEHQNTNRAQFEAGHLMSSSSSPAFVSQTPSISDHHASSSLSCLIEHSTATDINELLRNADWEDLQTFLLGRAAASTASANYTNPFYF